MFLKQSEIFYKKISLEIFHKKSSQEISKETENLTRFILLIAGFGSEESKGGKQSMVDDPSRAIDADRGKDAGIHSREIDREVSVAEVMNKAVIVMDINSDIPAIAREMVSRDAGSVIITENGKAMGILTERDLVRGIVTEDKRPSEVKASEIFSTPLVTIEPEKVYWKLPKSC